MTTAIILKSQDGFVSPSRPIDKALWRKFSADDRISMQELEKYLWPELEKFGIKVWFESEFSQDSWPLSEPLSESDYRSVLTED